MSPLSASVGGMNEQPLDLRRLFTAIARRRLLFAVVLAAGLAGGVVVAMLQTPIFTSQATVLLPPSDRDANGNELRDIATELNLVMSSEILDRARRTAGTGLQVEELQRSLSVEAVSNEILRIRAAATSPEQAMRLANAVATEYVAFSIDDASERVGTTISALKGQAAELEARIERLDEEIATNTALLRRQPPGSPEALRTAAIIDALRLDQVDAARQLSSVNARVADAELSAALSRRGTRVLETATVTDEPRWPGAAALPMAIGGGIGLLLAAALAFARDKYDRRLRTRDEVAEAVGAPVVASLPVPRCKGVNGCRALLQRWTASATERIALRHAFAQLRLAELGPGANLVVIVLAGDRSAVLLAGQLATFAASSGTRTAFAVCSDDPAVAHIRSACKSVEPQEADGPAGDEPEFTARPHLCLHDLGADGDLNQLTCADLTVAVAVADGDTGQLVIPSRRSPTTTATAVSSGWATAGDAGQLVIPSRRSRATTAIAVSSGWATADQLVAVASLCQEAGHPLGGVFLADPERHDRTTGNVGPWAQGTAPGVTTQLTGFRTESA